MLLPSGAVERVVRNFEPGDFRERLCRGGFVVAVGALIGGNDFQLAVACQISKENANEPATSRGDFGDDTRPAPAPDHAARILQVEQVALLAGHDGIGKPVAVQVADRDVLGRPGFGAFGQGKPKPLVGVFETERHAHMVTVFVDGDDVDMAVLVEVRGLQTISAAQADAAAPALVVDGVFTPRDIWPIGQLSARHAPGNCLGSAGRSRTAGPHERRHNAKRDQERFDLWTHHSLAIESLISNLIPLDSGTQP